MYIHSIRSYSCFPSESSSQHCLSYGRLGNTRGYRKWYRHQGADNSTHFIGHMTLPKQMEQTPPHYIISYLSTLPSLLSEEPFCFVLFCFNQLSMNWVNHMNHITSCLIHWKWVSLESRGMEEGEKRRRRREGDRARMKRRWKGNRDRTEGGTEWTR